MSFQKILKTSSFSNSKIDAKFIVLFGVPGVGKGTYGNLLEKDLSYYKLTPGDIIRKIIKTNQSNDEFTLKL